MDKEATTKFVDEHWDNWYIEGLKAFVRIPNISLLYDPDYLTNGLIEQTVDLVEEYAQRL